MAERVVMLVRNAYTHDTRVEKEARTLTDAGYDVTIVADAGSGLPAREERDGSTVIRIARPAAWIPGLRFLLHQVRLARILGRLRPDVLHAHDTNALIPVAVAARETGVPFVYDAHDLWLGRPRRERSPLYFWLNQRFYELVERLLVRRAAAVLTVSAPIAAHLEQRYGIDPVVLVPNYPELTELPTEVRDLRSLPGGERVAPSQPIVLYLGGLMGGRGLEQLVDAMEWAEGADLVMLGDGVLAEPLRRRALSGRFGERVHLLPPVPPDDVIAFAMSADVGVSPIIGSCLNYRYSLPNKLFQYMAARLPVVASDFPQVREIVEGARCGLVADTSRPREIADAINRVLDDRETAREMGKRAQQAVRERYHWGVAADALLAVYRRLLG